MTVLKPCPFCGGTPVMASCSRQYQFNPTVECQCGAASLSHALRSEADAIAAWNARATPTGGGEVGEDVKHALQEISDCRHILTMVEDEAYDRAAVLCSNQRTHRSKFDRVLHLHGAIGTISAALAAVGVGGGQRWTTEPPTIDGHYWCKCVGVLSGNVRPHVVRVCEHGKQVFWDGENFAMHSDRFLEWSGPLPPPPQGGESGK